MKKALSGSLVLGFALFAALVSLPVCRPGIAQSGRSVGLLRPRYDVDLTIDYEMLTLKGAAHITVPASSADQLEDVVFFLHANSKGTVQDERHRNLVVDRVALKNAVLAFKLQGTVLRVELPEAQSSAFVLDIDYHGIVPRAPVSSEAGGLAGLLGASSVDFAGLLEGTLGGRTAESGDYGLYTYGHGILSLGSFWYPQLAVRENRRWAETGAAAFGDMAYAENSDFKVRLTAPSGAAVAATGQAAQPGLQPAGSSSIRYYAARDVRDFALLLSEDFVTKAQSIEQDGRRIVVEAYLANADEPRLARVIEIGAEAVRIFSRRFGPYPYDTLKIVEAPIRGGAAAMEYSGLVAISPMILQDWEKGLKTLGGSFPLAGLENLLAGLNAPGGSAPARGRDQQGAQNPLGGLLQTFLGTQTKLLGSLMEMTIAHEVAHQWWAMSVGSDSVREPFVDESLANYSTIIYFEDHYGKEEAASMQDLHLKTAYSMSRMFGIPDAPANLPASSYANSIQYFAVVYGKGALYYDALRKAVGDEAFFAALRDYYKTYRSRLAGSRALLRIMQTRAFQADVEALYRHWIEEKHGDEDIAGGNIMGVGELLNAILSGRGIPQPKPSVPPPPR